MRPGAAVEADGTPMCTVSEVVPDGAPRETETERKSGVLLAASGRVAPTVGGVNTVAPSAGSGDAWAGDSLPGRVPTPSEALEPEPLRTVRKEMPDRMLPSPLSLPVKNSGETKLPAVVLPSEVGWKATISPPVPETPLTAKLPRVVRYSVGRPDPFAFTATASTSSLASFSPTSLPSKYMAQRPAVFAPREVGVKTRMSSSAPDTPGTLTFPLVEMSSRPSPSMVKASMPSALVVLNVDELRPTSLPSKYILQVPALTEPSGANAVTVNLTTSSSRIVPREVPPIVPASAKDR